MKSIFRLTVAACVLVGLTAEQASADILYTLNGAYLKDVVSQQPAGELTGWFITNDERTVLKEAYFDAPQADYGGLPPLGLFSFHYSQADYGDIVPSSTTGTVMGGALQNGMPLPSTLMLTGSTNDPNDKLTLLFMSGLNATGDSYINPTAASGEKQSHVGSRWVTGGYVTASEVTPIPEPSTIAVVAICGPALLAYGWRRRKAAGAA